MKGPEYLRCWVNSSGRWPLFPEGIAVGEHDPTLQHRISKLLGFLTHAMLAKAPGLINWSFASPFHDDEIYNCNGPARNYKPPPEINLPL